MSKIKIEIKNLQKNEGNGYTDLSFWGIIGSIVLFIFHLTSIIILNTKSNVNANVFHISGEVMGIMFLGFGVFCIIRIIKKQEGKYWSTFLAALVFAILTSLGWFNIAGLIFSFLSGALFLIYQRLEDKELIKNSLHKKRKPKTTKK